ncbi:MAG: molybdopterin-dependent oxidoreductase [Pseudomonadota bacterium]|nr:molybdopterin-dependent oxidoreductase [Pseudomonadota bacterium]
MDRTDQSAGAPQGGVISQDYSASETSVSDYYTVACPGMGCHQNCPLSVEVADGRIKRIEAAPIPGSPENTHACLRGIGAHQLPYLPNRLLYPKKRVGKRGEGKWQRISWDEALDTVAAQIKQIQAEYGPEAVLMSSSGSSAVPIGGLNAGGATTRLGNLLGCTDIVGWTVDGGPFCAGLVNYGFFFGGGNDAADWVNSDLLVIWGENMAESAMRDFNHAMRAKQQGTKVVVVSPTYDATAALASEWIPVESRTDAALALAMLHVILDEERFDAEYVAHHTVAPFLVRNDNGQFLRESDIAADGNAENYVVWDAAAGRPVAMPPNTQKLNGVTPALRGNFDAAGTPCRTAFDLLAERAAEYVPERATDICQLPAEKIRAFAREYADAGAAAIKLGFGVARTFYGDLNCRAIMALAAVTGNVGKSGGGASGWCRAYAPFLNGDPLYAADERRSKRLHISTGYGAIARQDPWPIKAWLLFAANPLNTQPNANTWINDILPQLDLVVAVDIVNSWTSEYADIVLPGATIFEREDLYTGLGCTILSEQAIEPEGEARTDLEICTELAQRLGLGEFFDKSQDEWLELMLDHPSQGGVTLEQLRANDGMVRTPGPTEPIIGYADKKFDTRSGRIEFYAEYLKEIGQELPTHLDPPEGKHSKLAQKYPLQFFTGRRKYVNQSQSYFSTTKTLCPEPLLRMNPLDAKPRGIKDDDLVRVFNDRGEVRLKAILTEAMRPGTVWVEHGWWPKDFAGGHYQNLLKPVCAPDESMINPAFQVFWEMYKDYAEQAPSPGLTPYGIADQLFDCMAQVETVAGA